ncbi:uncharacterized protein BYT42DRAFT_491740 [Radiomyces spectabilis]|uniref:uncharacterized protein n=1 Tax=Radiomyces spectabilis TaxID=64574 RepID=UPI0022211BD4|nr:uncharacterized protein BYT42DRAFT_491740 [Radiomyces spectabilis]KAI8388332.1 hypothetical protein BYT42DRAFT_491740 [Radiomyces spectabilis]
MICSRSLSLTQRKNTVSQKTLDNTLQRKDPQTGEVVSVSSRCADMDAELPVHLGVPKAILDNVIFCHQEDSNWPLAEPGTLKKKFDEILASTKYTKALDSIKDIRKKKAQEIRVDQVKLEQLKTDIEKAQRLRYNIDDLQKRMANKQEQIATVDQQLNETAHEIDSLLQVFQRAEAIESRLAQTQHQKKMLQDTMQDIAKNLTERHESDEEIRELLTQYQSRSNTDEEAKEDLMFEKSRIERQLQTARSAISEKLTAVGRLEAAAESNEQRLQERRRLLEQANIELDLGISSFQDIEGSMEILRNLVRSREENLSKLKLEARRHQTELSNALQNLRSERAGMEQGNKFTKQQMEQTKALIRKLDLQLADLSITETDLDLAKKKLSKQVKRKIPYMRCVTIIVTQKAQSSSRNMNDLLNQKERVLRDLDDQIQHQMQRQPTLESLENDVKSLLQSKADKVMQKQTSQEHKSRELSAVQARLSLAQKNLDEKRKDSQELEQNIQTVCGSTSVPEELDQLDHTLQDYREKIAAFGGAELMYKRFLKRTQQDSHCPLCVRRFSADDELTAFMKKLETTMAKIPDQQRELKKALAECVQRQTRVKALSGPWEKLQTVRQEIDDLRGSVKAYEKEKNEAAREADGLSDELMALQSEKQQLESLLKRSEEVSRYQRECKQLEEEIGRLEAELRKTGSTRTVTECQNEIEALSDKRLRHQLQQQLKQAHDESNEASKKIKEFDQKIEPFNEQIERASTKLTQAQNSWQTKQDEGATLVNQARQNLSRLQTLNEQINRFEENMGREHLEKLLNERRNLETKVTDLLGKQDVTEQKIRALEKELLDRKGIERELNDHLRYRSMKQQWKDCDRQLSELRVEQQQFEKSSYERQLQKLQDTQAKLIDSRGRLHGEVRQMKDQIDRYKGDLTTDYSNVEDNYRRQFIQVKTNEMAISDLEIYSKALEGAIMRYHSLKMQDLNKIIRDLWVNTYQGGDIDYIEVRSDNEGSASNRSYNYRVVMIKNGKELNMRGRCSAGQKVLTSTIVRLALAETFCIHCGILTLDEPTTNLDRENIESLAASLGRIIQTRRAQSNFQLIVITHDELFVEYLARSDVTDFYYRVSKDAK